MDDVSDINTTPPADCLVQVSAIIRILVGGEDGDADIATAVKTRLGSDLQVEVLDTDYYRPAPFLHRYADVSLQGEPEVVYAALGRFAVSAKAV